MSSVYVYLSIAIFAALATDRLFGIAITYGIARWRYQEEAKFLKELVAMRAEDAQIAAAEDRLVDGNVLPN